MALIKKKIWPEFFEAVVSGKMRCELRLGDFDIAEGDTLLLEEWDPVHKIYTGRRIEKKVLDVRKFKLDASFWSEEDIKKHGLQIISLE